MTTQKVADWIQPHLDELSRFKPLKRKPNCKVPGCEREQTLYIFCLSHYNSAKKAWKPGYIRAPRTKKDKS